MSRRGLQAALAGALICATAPCAAFDSISDSFGQKSQGVTFYVSVPLDAPRARDRTFGAGLLIQGKREQAYNFDSRLFNNFLGSGIEAKWIIAGVVAAGAAVAVGSKSKTQSSNEQITQQQAQQQVQQQQAGGTASGGSFHPDGTPHVPGDNCACHGGTAP